MDFENVHYYQVKNMKKLILIIFPLAFIFGLTSVASARSGCCSHHGGVCGCNCCDGTSLSATCAPYYPACSRTANNQTTATVKKVATLVTAVKPVATYFVGEPTTYAELYSCKIVGNYNSMIYFPQDSSYIKQMNLKKKECFANSIDAIKKGFRKVK
jgi:hypothetical protein